MTSPKLRRSTASIAQSRWTAYAAAGAATAIGSVATTQEAVADIHYSGTINQSFHATGSYSTASAVFALAPGANFVPAHVNFYSGIGAAFFGVFAAVSGGMNGFSAGYPYISRLIAGQNPAALPFLINPTSGEFGSGFGTLAFANGYGNDQWLDAGTGFVGFRFNTGAGIQYGWARITMDGSPGNSFTLVDYAWGDVGEMITAGQTTSIPEPGSLALLAVGAVGLMAWRRQRAKVSKAA